MPEASTTTATATRVRMWPAAVWLALIGAATLFVYHDLLKTPFFLDDYLHLHLIQQLQHPFEPFYQDIFMGAFFRPAITVFWAIDHALYGLKPTGYYVSNLIYLLSAIVLLYAVMHNLVGSHAVAGLTSLLFAMSPVTGVGAEWLSNRFDLIGTVFFLASTLMFLRFTRFRRAGDYALSLACAVIAYFCKEITITLPVILALGGSFMFMYRAPRRFDGRLVRRLISYTTPFFTLAGAFMLWRYLVIRSLGGYVGEAKEPLTVGYFFFLWRSFGEYVWLTRNLFVAVGLLVLVALFLARPRFYSANKLFLFGLAFALITAAPLAMILKQKAVMSYMTPRFFFLPNLGAAIALASLYDPRGGRVRRAAAAILLTLLVAATGLNNYILIHKWQRDKSRLVARMTEMADSVTAGAERAPDSSIIYTCLPGLDVALDAAIKVSHPQFLDKYYFLNCQGPTQTIADRTLYQANRRLLNFPASFARNPCTYESLVYGVVDASPRSVLDQFRGGAAALVVDFDKDGRMTLLDREQVVRMLAIRYGIQLDEPKPPA